MSTQTRYTNRDHEEKSAQPNRLDNAIEKAKNWLLHAQAEDGYWVGELEGDTILESEYIITMTYLGRGDRRKMDKAARYILSRQLENGGWALFPDGPTDISSSVKAYLALKLTIATGDEPYMEKARAAIADAGGVQAVNSYTKFYLAMLGQIKWNDAPAVPPELILLPNWLPLNIYAISSWSRTFVVPLSIIWSRKITCQLPPRFSIHELFQDGDRKQVRARREKRLFSWKNFFLRVDSILKLAERLHLLPLRKKAIRTAEQWMLARFENSAGLGAIFPPIIYSLIAMKALGYDDNDPQVQRAMDELTKLEIEEGDKLRLQPCTSPVWDTAIIINALAEAGMHPDDPHMLHAAEWILSKEVRIRGDWSVTHPRLQPGGWYFEFANDFYPDIDDTAMVLMALKKTGNLPGKNSACRRGLDWLLGMQGKDGGWASFDSDNNNFIFDQIPFADHNAMLDPSTSDITARILEMLSFFDIKKEASACTKAIRFLEKEQESDGSWYGRWGVNYIYGTWQGIRGLTRIGVDKNSPTITRAAQWLLNVQNDDGGWGESCISYWYPALRGRGESTPSQTAWALMGLICAGKTESDAVKRGIEFLINKQNADGAWEETQYTGAGFPKVFFLRYHLYRQAFPTMALGMYRNAMAETEVAQHI